MSENLGVTIGARRLVELIGEVGTGSSFYRALADRLRLLIIDGRIPVGTRLPSERELAGCLHRSRSTIVASYTLLRELGYVRSRQGSGTVATLPATPLRRRPIDFAHAVTEPVPGLAAHLQRATADPERLFAGPGFDMHGDEDLRARIAARYTGRGVPTRAADVVVTVGGQHAISSIAHALVRRGDRVLMDSPCYPHAYEAFHGAGARIVTSPVGHEGWDVDHYVAALHRFRPALAFLMPDFQNPTGASMAPGARTAIAEAAARAGTVLVVDETTADLDIDRGWDDGPMARYGAIHGTEVLTVGSLSKSIWGGLRLGWIRGGTESVQRLLRRRPAFDLGTPRLEQVVAADLFPELPRLLASRSRLLREARDHLIAELLDALPDWEVPRPAGGTSLWVRMDRPVGTALAAVAQTRGMLISAGPRFTLNSSHERFLRLPYTEPRAELSQGVAVLRQIWSTLDPSSEAFEGLLDSVV